MNKFVEVVKEMEQDEIEEVFQIESEAFINNYRLSTLLEYHGNRRYSMLGSYDKKGNILGYIILLDSIDVFEVIKIAVKKNYRGKGIGRYILEKVIENLDKDLFLEVREGNERAIKLYEKIGFEKISVRKNYYKDTGEDGIIYSYKIGEGKDGV